MVFLVVRNEFYWYQKSLQLIIGKTHCDMFCYFSVLLFIEILLLIIQLNKFSLIVHTQMSMGFFPEINIGIDNRHFELQFHLFFELFLKQFLCPKYFYFYSCRQRFYKSLRCCINTCGSTLRNECITMLYQYINCANFIFTNMWLLKE